MIENIKDGDFISMYYGFDRDVFYVVHAHKDSLCITKTSWCVSNSINVDEDFLSFHKARFICNGKRRWWRELLPFVKDLIPMYRMAK